MSARLELDGKVAVVTGAASGIGRAIAQSFASRGCNVALADIDEVGLEETARLIGNRVRVTRHRLDVADGEAIAAFPATVKAAHGGVDVVVNNAGVALGGSFEQLTEAELDWLMSINFQGVVRMSRAFLPLLKERGSDAQLVNVSSLFGLIAPPGQAAYSAAKFAVRGFSEALRNELLAAKSRVGVTVVHPGGIKTSIAKNARMAEATSQEQRTAAAGFEKALKMKPAEAGEIIVRGIAERRPRILVGTDAKIVSIVERLFPVSYWRWLGGRKS